MKRITIILVVSLISGIALARIGIDFKNNGGTVSVEGGGSFVDQVLVQLIWTASVPAQQAELGGALGAGEQVLYSLLTTPGFAGTWSDLYPGIGVLEFVDANVSDDINAGYFFVRMFDNSKLDEGDYYLQQYVQGPVLTDYDINPRPTPYSTFQQLGGDIDSQGYQIIIPEPAVVSLVVIFGGGLLVSRRMFSKV